MDKKTLAIVGAAVLVGAFLFKSKGGASVTGTVLNNIGGVVADATVSISNKSAVTDSMGHFTIANVSPGRNTIKVVADGYDTYVSSITLDAGENIVNINISGTSDTASLSGYVLNSDTDEPVVNATVLLSANGQNASVKTNTNGFFQFLQLTIGATVNWSITATGYVTKYGTITFTSGINSLDVNLDPVVSDTYGAPFTYGQINGLLYSGEDVGQGPVKIPIISIIIHNNSGQPARHKIGVYCDYYAQPYSQIIDAASLYCGGSEKFVLLNPGESYSYEYDAIRAIGTGAALPALYNNFVDFWIQDENGNRSGSVRLTY